MTTSTLIYVDGMPTVIFDHGPRSRWANAWRAVRSDDQGDLVGSSDPLINEAYALLMERRRATSSWFTFTLKEELELKRDSRLRKLAQTGKRFASRQTEDCDDLPF